MDASFFCYSAVTESEFREKQRIPYLFATVATDENPDSLNMNGNIAFLLWDARISPAVPVLGILLQKLKLIKH